LMLGIFCLNGFNMLENINPKVTKVDCSHFRLKKKPL
jgi:hypothetical protein